MLRLENGLLSYKLKPLEVIGAFAPSPSIPISCLRSISIEETPWSSKILRGIRAPGTGLPFLIMLGTMRHRGGKDFCVVYKNQPVLVLEFEGGAWARWVVPATEQNKAVLRQSQALSQ